MAETEIQTKPAVAKRAYKRRGPGRPKGSKRGPGRPKGPAKSRKVAKGLIAAVVAKQLKGALRAQRTQMKDQVRTLVAKEVKKAIKAAFR